MITSASQCLLTYPLWDVKLTRLVTKFWRWMWLYCWSLGLKTTQNLTPTSICVHVSVPSASWWGYVINPGWCSNPHPLSVKFSGWTLDNIGMLCVVWFHPWTSPWSRFLNVNYVHILRACEKESCTIVVSEGSPVRVVSPGHIESLWYLPCIWRMKRLYQKQSDRCGLANAASHLHWSCIIH